MANIDWDNTRPMETHIYNFKKINNRHKTTLVPIQNSSPQTGQCPNLTENRMICVNFVKPTAKPYNIYFGHVKKLLDFGINLQTC